MKRVYYNTATIFRENKQIKKAWQKKLKRLKLEDSDFIRKSLYEAIDKLGEE